MGVIRKRYGVLLTGSLGFAPAALADAPWSPQWRSVLSVEQPVEGLHLTVLNEKPALLVQESDFLRFRQPQTGAVLAEVKVQVKDIAEWAQTPRATFATCSETGLHLIQAGPAHIVTMTQIQEEPCDLIETAQIADTTLVALVRDQAIGLYQVDSTGVWEKQDSIELPDGSVPLMRASAHSIAVGWKGAEYLTEVSHRGLMNIPTGGPVEQLAYGPTGWIWTLENRQAVIPLSGKPSPTDRAIANMTTLDLDGDSREDVLIHHTEGPATLLWGTLTQSSLDAASSNIPPVAGDFDGDNCPELVTAQGTEIWISYGQCGAVPLNEFTLLAPSVPVATPTHQFKLGHDVEFHAHVGQTLRIQLAHPDTHIERFAARGGPLWLKVSPNGILSYTPTVQDVGMWELTILAWETLGRVERYPFVFKVHRTADAKEAEPTTSRLRRRSRTYSNVRLLNNRLAFGFGGSIGFSEARNSWANLGTDWVVSGSPHFSLQLDNPEESGVWWSLAGESAPWFKYLTENMEMHHYLSTLSTVGWNFGEKFQAGVFGQAGFFITAVGIRTRWFPYHHAKSNTRHGMEFRVSWLPSNAGFAAYGAAFYVVRLPKGL